MAAPAADPTPSGPPDPAYETHAWLRCRTRNTPGVLSLHDGRLSFTRDGQVLFDERTESSAVEFPWYRFAGEMRVTAAGHRHRVSLTPPHGTGEAGSEEVGGTADGRRAGRIWRTLLTH